MKIYLKLDKNAKKDRIINQINKFRNSSNVYDAGTNIVVHLNDPLLINEPKIIKKLEKKYKIAGIKEVIVSPVKGSKGEIRHKNFHCFFDIDSTLTRGNGVINKRIREIFDKMKNDNMRIYLVSGRSIPQIIKDMNEFETEPYGIAENGGIIIGIGSKGEFQFGDRQEPDILDAYLKSNCPKIKEDIKQGFRKTERIYLQTISRTNLGNYITKSKAKIDVHASKNSYHVCKKNVNKGTAVEKFTCDMKFGPNDIIIAVGDADMDVPMLKNAEVGFAVGNASTAAIKAAHIPLTYEHDKGIKEMYEKLQEFL